MTEETNPETGKSIPVQPKQEFHRINAPREIKKLTFISNADNFPEIKVLLWPYSLHIYCI